MQNTCFVIGAILISLLMGCDNNQSAKEVEKSNIVTVNFTELVNDPSADELKRVEKCLSKFATKLEKDLNNGGLNTEIFTVYAHKVFTDSQNNINAQYSILGMHVLSNGKEQSMDDKKQMINCVSQM